MKSKNSINKFFFKISVFLVLSLVVFFLSPFVLNLNSYKSKLEVELSSAFHSQVRIDGGIQYSIQSGPKIYLHNVTLENDFKEALTGNINTIEISINPLHVLMQKFLLKNIKLFNGSLSIPANFIEGIIQENKIKLANLSFDNLDVKIFNNASEFQLDSNTGSLVYDDTSLVASAINGSLGTFAYQLRYKDNFINFTIPQIKLETEYQIKSNNMKNSFLQIKSANNLFFPGFKNIYLRTDVVREQDKIIFDDVKLTSSMYNGIGLIEFITNPNLIINSNFSFGRTNFSTVSKTVITNFFQNALFDIASLFDASFKINFKNVLMEQDYFKDVDIDVNFIEGDIVVNNFELISSANHLKFTGRIINDNKDKLFFFKTKFQTSELKKLCIKTCKNLPKQNNYSMVSEGVYNIKKAKVTLDDFFSTRQYTKQEIATLNNDLNKMIDGSIQQSLELKNFLSLY